MVRSVTVWSNYAPSAALRLADSQRVMVSSDIENWDQSRETYRDVVVAVKVKRPTDLCWRVSCCCAERQEWRPPVTGGRPSTVNNYR